MLCLHQWDKFPGCKDCVVCRAFTNGKFVAYTRMTENDTKIELIVKRVDK